MPEMPTLGEQPKQTPVVPIAITAVIVGLVLGGIYWLRNRPSETATTEPAAVGAPAVAAPGAEGVAAQLPPGVPAAIPTVAAAAAQPNAPAAVAPSPSAAAEKAGLKSFMVSINGPLESAIVTSQGKEVGTPLTQVVNRSLVWWVRVPQDLVKGDTLSVVYETRDGQEPLVHAVRFESRKMGKTFEAYRYKTSPEGFARYYQADGSELEERLVDSPLETYEQITSLLRDGRKHKGVDFKTPVGTPVLATFDGVVLRKNWNFRGNGNSIELKESGGQGRSALFLHLSELPKTLAAGQRFKRGEVIGKSGNTGHSFAPHLHYQLMRGDTVVDPFDSHKTTRLSLPAADRAGFDKKMNELKALMPATEVVGG
jgi:murein DD-endopeptidase MepM/ murein hydrolase activator NlpD